MSDRRLIVSSMTEYTPKGASETRTAWNRIGMAFRNRDGSINVELNATPISGRLQIREETDDERHDREQRDRNRGRDDRAGEQRRDDRGYGDQGGRGNAGRG